MKDIIKLIIKYHFTIIFVLLEIIAFSLMVMHNNYQRTIFSSYTSSFFGAISSTVTEIKTYFYLKETNKKLVAENIELRNQIEKARVLYNESKSDSLWHSNISAEYKYIYIMAEMLNAGLNKTKNYIIINKGSLHGITSEMAVCSSEGVVGIVEKTSKHFSKILPLININLRVSAKIKKNGYYGSLQWDGNDYRYTYLNDIPFHVDAEVGDTIVTSGLSPIFPEGEIIGFIESVNKKTANFLRIKVKLATDFKKIFDVYIIANTQKREQEQLEVIGDE